MSTAQTSRLSTLLPGAAGVVSIVIATVAALMVNMFDLPGTGASAAEIVADVRGDRATGLAAMVLNTVTITLWLDFASGVWARLRRDERTDEYLLACFGFGFAALVTLLFAGFAVFFVLLYRSGDVGDARMLYDLTFGLLAMSGAPTVLSLGAFATLVYIGGPFPRWTAHLATLAAVAHAVLLGSFLVSRGFFSLEGEVIIAIPATLFAWILGTGIALMRER